MIKVGIFFGGPSREREVSFAGGRTVYDNLDKALFEPIPIFVDSMGRFILLQWQYLYKGSIRDFYPPTDLTTANEFSVYRESLGVLEESREMQLINRVGRRITPDQFARLFDIAFLVLHGPFGEDGTLQGLLEWYRIPYTGTGVFGAALGIDKAIQKRLMQQMDLPVPRYKVLSRDEWLSNSDDKALFEEVISEVGLPMVVKSTCQGSSIGVSVIREHAIEPFVKAVDRSFFIQEVDRITWKALSFEGKRRWMASLIDLREGIGLPVLIDGQVIDHPEALLQYLNHHFSISDASIKLSNPQGEAAVLFEAYLEGREFSCIVLEAVQGYPMALPPTEIHKEGLPFDYRAKYLPGIVRKETPMRLPVAQLQAIKEACKVLFKAMEFQVYARIDGFLTSSHQVYLNDPNTTSGMYPASLLFHQAAEIGLNPTQLLTLLIRASLGARTRVHGLSLPASRLADRLDQYEAVNEQSSKTTRLRVGVIMGGFSAERHISLESGRNVFEKLASSRQYTPIPIFLSGTPEQHRLFVVPMRILLKDNADDIHEQLLSDATESYYASVQSMQQAVDAKVRPCVDMQDWQVEELDYQSLSQRIDFAFIALHGRPGEDGVLQTYLTQQGIPYNGSGIQSTQLTIDKFRTNQFLRSKGIRVADQMLIGWETWKQDTQATIAAIEAQLRYPCIAKPADEGCSAAVVKIANRAMLMAYAAATFRTTQDLLEVYAPMLSLQPNAEFPRKPQFLLEELVSKGDAAYFLEITGGLLTHMDGQGRKTYEIFVPSEVLATQEILSLEEKFLVGEGQNITPARFHTDPSTNEQITNKVRQDLEKVACLLRVEGYARIDAFVKVYDPMHVETWIIEVNSLPGVTPATCIFHQGALHGYTPFAFMHHIIQYGIRSHALA